MTFSNPGIVTITAVSAGTRSSVNAPSASVWISRPPATSGTFAMGAASGPRTRPVTLAGHSPRMGGATGAGGVIANGGGDTADGFGIAATTAGGCGAGATGAVGTMAASGSTGSAACGTGGTGLAEGSLRITPTVAVGVVTAGGRSA